MKKIVIISSIIIVAILGIIWFSMSVSTTNTEIDLRATTLAQNKKCEIYFDKMWKIVIGREKILRILNI